MVRNDHRLSQEYGCGGGGHAPAVSLSDTVLSQIIKKESQYCAGIKANHVSLKAVTHRLCDIQTLLAPSNNNTASESPLLSPQTEELLKVIQTQKQVIRTIAKENVQREQYVRTFCDTLQNIRQSQPPPNTAPNESSQPPDDGTTGTTPTTGSANSILPFDYQVAITNGMEALGRKRHINQEELIQQEPFYREIAEVLGDPKPTATSTSANKHHRGRTPRRNGGGEDDDDDDDIEVTQMTNTAHGSSGAGHATNQQLKCPLTQTFMTDAVENTVCHHIYSRDGIMAYIAQQRKVQHRSVKCPVFGCVNSNVTVEQLHDHYETSLMSKREIRRQDLRNESNTANQKHNSNDVLVDSDEE